ncbi:MAG: DUF1269 domain-containing protein [Pseudomonadota bacterium]|nr:DUF1269 domain-containing protein [Pseudomonadota bacterium]
MRRLYVLLPTEESCRAVVEELEDADIPASHLHVIAGLSHELKDLPEASVWQRTELAHGIEWGVGLGGVAGLLGGLLVVAFPPAGVVLGGGALLAGTAAGAGFGALVTALLGSQEHNHRLDTFQRALAAGELLLLVDVPRQRENAVRATILKHHPEAEIGSVKRIEKD